MTRDHASTAAVGALLALALVPAFWPSGAMAQNACFDEATDLIAAETMNVGDVNVCNDDTTLTVTYELTSPWCLLATHLHVATSEDDIPQNVVGIPLPGQFDHGDDYDPCVDTATFHIDLADIGDTGVSPGDTVVVAAHAEVLNLDTLEEEGAWGAGTRFVERGTWAMYFTYEVQEAAVPCPEACVAGLEAFADAIGAATLVVARCGFDTGRQAGEVVAVLPDAPRDVAAFVSQNFCAAATHSTDFVSIGLSNAEQASCAPLAIDILPGVDETNCDISPR